MTDTVRPTQSFGFDEVHAAAAIDHAPLAIVHELRAALRAQRDHLEDMLAIIRRLEAAFTRLATERGGQ
jgi:hypothetical protein